LPIPPLLSYITREFPMGERNYLRYFTETDRLRVFFTTAHGEVQGFVVQFEIFVEEEWMPVVRYDTAHGFFHVDLLKPHGPVEKIVMNFTDYGKALTFAIAQIQNRWKEFRKRYVEDMQL
jgi:hypothetical protein